MKKKGLFITLALVVVMSLVAACAAPAPTPAPAPPPAPAPAPAPTPAAPEEVFQWRMASSGTRGSQLHNEHLWVIEEIEKASGGRLKVTELFAAGELFPVVETLPSTAKGVVEMSATFAGYWGGLDPAFTSGSTLPGPMPDYDVISQVMELQKPILKELYGREGAHLAGIIAHPPECFLSNVPVWKVADFQGLKIRCGGLQAKVMEKMGCTVIFLSAPEIYTAFQLGTIDAGEFSGFRADWDMGFQEVTKYITEPTPHCGCGYTEIIVDQEAWDSLPADLQAIVELAVWAGSAHNYTEMRLEDLEARQKFIDYGLEVCTLPPEEWAKVEVAAFQVWDEWAAEHADNAFVQQQVELNKRVSRLFGFLVD